MNSVAEFRVKVLEDSLDFEANLSLILTRLFKLSEDAKVFGDTSMALSFMTKVEFLKDLGHFTKEQYQYFVLFIEIRNKVIHNLNIDSLEKAVTKVNKPKLFFSLNDELTERFNLATSFEEKNEALSKLYSILISKNLHSLKSVLSFIQKSIQEEKRTLELELLSTNRRVLLKCFVVAINKVFNEIEVLAPDKKSIIIEKFSSDFFSEMKKVVKPDELYAVNNDFGHFFEEAINDIISRNLNSNQSNN